MIKSKQIKINNKIYVLKAQSYRAMFLFEDITDKSIGDLKTLRDQVVYIYCILKTSNKEFEYDLENFIDLLEENNNILEEFAALTTQKKKLN